MKKEIELAHFREDLFYRISAFQIDLPPLRERLVDIELLAKHFLDVFSLKMNKKIIDVHPDFYAKLKMHHWNGNIRELKNVIERCLILSESQTITIDNLPIEFKNISFESKQLSAFDLASAEKLHIQKVLNYANGNKTKTAELLNIALTTLYRKIEEYKIS